MANKLCPITWYGGKTSHLNWLLPIIDNTPHITYVESFGGSAAVLLNKKPSNVEIYNDIYSDVVDFFRVLRNRPHDLISLLQLTPYSREEFRHACSTKPIDELEKARLFFVKARQVRTGLVTTASNGRWRYIIKDSRRGMSQSVSQWLSAVDGLEDVCMRLKMVQLENLDGLEIIKRYDREGTLHYIDPPYLMSSRPGGVGYHNEFSDDRHKELLSQIQQLKGKVIISGYDNDLYNTILDNWLRYEAPPKYTASTRQTGRSSLRQEIIWLNYDFKFSK